VKLTNVKIESIAAAFRDHELGNIQVDDMVRYYCPKSVKLTSTNADDVNEDLANRLTYTPFCSN